ncbi:hypothetical protein [Ornithinimicrobium kibberense]|uniref:hypothetical protein n=1 Tax=Ornithinimicrobium kibberense TaxID=282060 RepID=UPI00361B79E1
MADGTPVARATSRTDRPARRRSSERSPAKDAIESGARLTEGLLSSQGERTDNLGQPPTLVSHPRLSRRSAAYGVRSRTDIHSRLAPVRLGRLHRSGGCLAAGGQAPRPAPHPLEGGRRCPPSTPIRGWSSPGRRQRSRRCCSRTCAAGDGGSGTPAATAASCRTRRGSPTSWPPRCGTVAAVGRPPRGRRSPAA